MPISFLPPPLEGATYSVGIYDEKGFLVRRLKEFAPESAFTVGLNGLTTFWDGKDRGMQPVPPGRYSVRGYAVGPQLKVEGVGILGNDWASEDATLRVHQIEALAVVPEDEGLAAVAQTGPHQWELLRFAGSNGALKWRVPVNFAAAKSVEPGLTHNIGLAAGSDSLVVAAYGQRLHFAAGDGRPVFPKVSPASNAADPAPVNISKGSGETVWKVEEGVLAQYSAQGERLRSLAPKPDEPVPQAVAASTQSDRLFLLESAVGWQRVRGLSWVESAEEGGKPVSTWKTFFERNIRKDSPIPSDDLLTDGFPLVDNPLAPGKHPKVKLHPSVDDKGSYLATVDDLHLRRISENPDLSAVMLDRKKSAPGRLIFWQFDGAAWDQFSIEGARNMMAFDAGEIEMTAEGEKVPAAKPAEPQTPDL